MTESILRKKFLQELEVNFWEGWSLLGKGKNSKLYASENIIGYQTPLPAIPYNAVIKFQVTENVEQEIDDIINKVSKGGADFLWVITPSSEPKDLSKKLKKRGLIEAEVLTGMARTLSDLPEIPELPPGIEIRKLEDDRGKQEFIEFATWRWSIQEENIEVYQKIIEPFKFGQEGSKFPVWQAWMDGKPVSKVVVSSSRDSIGIYAVVTRPEARRMGLAKIITLHALHEMKKQGYEIAVLHSTPMAIGLYESMGFETLANFYLYAFSELHI